MNKQDIKVEQIDNDKIKTANDNLANLVQRMQDSKIDEALRKLDEFSTKAQQLRLTVEPADLTKIKDAMDKLAKDCTERCPDPCVGVVNGGDYQQQPKTIGTQTDTQTIGTQTVATQTPFTPVLPAAVLIERWC
jgi:hypothetical protein